MNDRLRRVVAFALCALAASSVLAQDGATVADRPVVQEAEPYERDEFPGWALMLRRGEIVALGALPVSLLASRLLYGLGRFTVQSIATRSLATAYLPELFAPPGAVPLTRQDNLRIVVGALTISGIIAIIDYALGKSESARVTGTDSGSEPDGG